MTSAGLSQVSHRFFYGSSFDLNRSAYGSFTVREVSRGETYASDNNYTMLKKSRINWDILGIHGDIPYKDAFEPWIHGFYLVSDFPADRSWDTTTEDLALAIFRSWIPFIKSFCVIFPDQVLKKLPENITIITVAALPLITGLTGCIWILWMVLCGFRRTGHLRLWVSRGGNMKRTICYGECSDVDKAVILPHPEIDVNKIKIVMVSEAPPVNDHDYIYESTEGSFFQTTKQAFSDAGIEINNYEDLTEMGVYLTTGIKCRKLDYLVSAKTIKECSFRYLEKEISRFPNLKIVMCMGDFAIKAVGYIYKKQYGKKPIRSGSTYKIRNEEHILNGTVFIPSYTQTGDSFNIEKSKRKMIAEDIKKAFSYID